MNPEIGFCFFLDERSFQNTYVIQTMSKENAILIDRIVAIAICYVNGLGGLLVFLILVARFFHFLKKIGYKFRVRNIVRYGPV